MPNRGVLAGPTQQATSRGLAALLLGVVLLTGLVVGSAQPAIARIANAVDDLQAGVHLEDGVEGIERAELEALVRSRASGESIAIVVLAAPNPPLDENARRVLEQAGVDTVLLFTPDDVAVASRLRDSQTVDAALERAGDAGRDADTVVAAGAILRALGDAGGGSPWGRIVGVLLVLVALAGGGGLWLVQRRQREAAEAHARRMEAVRAKLDDVAAGVVALRDRVDARHDDEISQQLDDVAVGYQDAVWSYERIHTDAQITRLDRRAEDLLVDLDRLELQLKRPAGS